MTSRMLAAPISALLVLCTPKMTWAQQEPEEAEQEQEAEAQAQTQAPAWADDEPTDATALDGPAERESRSRLGRLSPRWFWGALAITVGLGVATGVSGGYTLALNNRYLEEQRDSLLRSRGMSFQLATNVLIAVTSAAAIATAMVGIFTDWSSPRGTEEPDQQGPTPSE